MIPWTPLTDAWSDVILVLATRAAPVLAFLLITRQTRLGQKALVLGIAFSLGIVTLATSILPWTWFGLSYLYLILGAYAVPVVARQLQLARLSRAHVFIFSFSTFLLVPGLLWPAPMKMVALVLGWDLVLSSYSYCVETSRSSDQPRLSDCLFFLLVNPALVYSQRGTRLEAPKLSMPGIWRIVLGGSLFLLSALLLKPINQLAFRKSSASGFPYWSLFLLGSIAFAMQYTQASALASLQIGLLRQTGYEIPERYNWPLRARTLPEFWRRWNTYVGQWTLQYIFWPLSLELGRRFRNNRWRTLSLGAALIAAFTAVGFLHDVYTYLSGRPSHLKMTLLFIVNGFLVVIWLGLERIGDSLPENDRAAKWLTRLAVPLSRVGLWCFLAMFAAKWWLGI